MQQSIYLTQRQEECAGLSVSYEGSLDALFCVITFAPATPTERAALEATASRAGFSPAQMVWINASALDAPNLHKLVEAIDPLCIFALSQAATDALSYAYNHRLNPDACNFLLGRSTCCFTDFARMLEGEDRKQQAWTIMKETCSYIA